MLDVLVKQSVHIAAIVVRRIAESEQIPNFFQGHVKGTVVSYELKAFDISICPGPSFLISFQLTIGKRATMSRIKNIQLVRAFFW